MATVSELEVVLRGDDSQLQTTFNNANNRFSGFVSGAGRQVARVAAFTAGAALVVGGFAVNAAINWESSFADVRRTVDATDTEFADLEDTLRGMATDETFGALDNAHSTLAGIAALGGQLGVQTSDLDEFTSAVASTGVATGLASDDIALFFGQFANVVGIDASEYDNLADTIVHLGNTSATTEDQIMAFGSRLSGLSTVGFTPDEILGWGTAMAETGLNAEAGGTAFSTAVKDMQAAAVEGGPDLTTMANIAGTTADEFADLAMNDPSAAMESFITGLGEMDGTEVPAVLDELGLTGVRTQDMFMRLSGSSDGMTEALDRSEEAFKGNGAAMTEAGTKADTTQGNLNRLKNTFTELGIELGDRFLPGITNAASGLTEMLNGDYDSGLETLKTGVGEIIGNIVLLGSNVVDISPETMLNGIAAWQAIPQLFETVWFRVTDGLDDFFRDMQIKMYEGLVGIWSNIPPEILEMTGFDVTVDGLNVQLGRLYRLDNLDQFAEQFSSDISAAMASGEHIDISSDLFSMLSSGDFVAQLPPGAMDNIRSDLGAQMQEALAAGDAGAIQTLIPLAAQFDIDASAIRDSFYSDMLTNIHEGLTGMGDSIKVDLGAQMEEALAAGDTGAMQTLIPLAAQLDIDMSSMRDDVELKLAEAFVAEDEEMIQTLIPFAAQLDIDPEMVRDNADDIIVTAVESEEYEATVTVNLTMVPGDVNDSAIKQAVSGNINVGGGGGNTYNVNSYGQSPHELVQQVQTAQADSGGGGPR